MAYYKLPFWIYLEDNFEEAGSIGTNLIKKYVNTIEEFESQVEKDDVINDDINRLIEKANNSSKNNIVNFTDKCSFSQSISINIKFIDRKDIFFNSIKFRDNKDKIKTDDLRNIKNININVGIEADLDSYKADKIIEQIIRYKIVKLYFIYKKGLYKTYGDYFRGIVQTKQYREDLYTTLYPTTNKLLNSLEIKDEYSDLFWHSTSWIISDIGYGKYVLDSLYDLKKLKSEEDIMKRNSTLIFIEKLTALKFKDYKEMLIFIKNRIDTVVYNMIFEIKMKRKIIVGCSDKIVIW